MLIDALKVNSINGTQKCDVSLFINESGFQIRVKWQAALTKAKLLILVNGSVQYSQWTTLTVNNTVNIIKPYITLHPSYVRPLGVHPGFPMDQPLNWHARK